MLSRIALYFAAASIAWSADARALEVLSKAQQAAGGADKLAAIEDFIAERKIEAVGGGLSGRQVYKVVLPAAMRQESSLPFGTLVVSVVDGQGRMQSFQGVGPLPPAQLAQANDELFRLRESLLVADRDPDKTISFVAEEAVGDRAAQVIEVASAKTKRKVRLYIDAESGESAPDRLRRRRSARRVAYDPRALFRPSATSTAFERLSSSRPTTATSCSTTITIEKLLYNTGLTKAEL